MQSNYFFSAEQSFYDALAGNPLAYELYYSFKPNDSVTVTPAVFGGTDRTGTAGADIFGAVLETTFKF